MADPPNSTNPRLITYGELRGNADVWPGLIARGYMIDSRYQMGCYLDDRARAGKWDTVLKTLDPENRLVNVNQTPPGSTSRSTMLHRAAELGAPAQVVEALLAKGAFRSQRDGEGQTPHQIATDKSRIAKTTPEVIELLRPPQSPLEDRKREALEHNFTSVIDDWLQPVFGNNNLRNILVYPPVEVLHEAPRQELWVQVPKMSGGFRVTLRRGYLELMMGYRRFADSGEVHVDAGCYVITEAESIPVYRSNGVTWRPGQDKS